MKTVRLLPNIILLVLVGIACKRNGPEVVVEKYYTHICRNEFEEVQKYVTEENRSFYALLGKYAIDNTTEKPHVKVTNIKCEVTGDTVAFCSCMVQEGDQTPKEQKIPLKKIKGNWLVSQDFFSPLEDETGSSD